MALYADIIEIVAPYQAAAGSRVDIIVKVKNTYSADIGVKVVGVPEYVGLPPGLYIDFPEPIATVGPGDIQPFDGSFTMPDARVTMRIYTYWYGSDGYWHFDDEMTKIVELAAAPQPAISDFRVADYIKV